MQLPAIFQPLRQFFMTATASAPDTQTTDPEFVAVDGNVYKLDQLVELYSKALEEIKDNAEEQLKTELINPDHLVDVLSTSNRFKTSLARSITNAAYDNADLKIAIIDGLSDSSSFIGSATVAIRRGISDDISAQLESVKTAATLGATAAVKADVEAQLIPRLQQAEDTNAMAATLLKALLGTAITEQVNAAQAAATSELQAQLDAATGQLRDTTAALNAAQAELQRLIDQAQEVSATQALQQAAAVATAALTPEPTANELKAWTWSRETLRESLNSIDGHSIHLWINASEEWRQGILQVLRERRSIRAGSSRAGEPFATVITYEMLPNAPSLTVGRNSEAAVCIRTLTGQLVAMGMDTQRAYRDQGSFTQIEKALKAHPLARRTTIIAPLLAQLSSAFGNESLSSDIELTSQRALYRSMGFYFNGVDCCIRIDGYDEKRLANLYQHNMTNAEQETLCANDTTLFEALELYLDTYKRVVGYAEATPSPAPASAPAPADLTTYLNRISQVGLVHLPGFNAAIVENDYGLDRYRGLRSKIWDTIPVEDHTFSNEDAMPGTLRLHRDMDRRRCLDGTGMIVPGAEVEIHLGRGRWVYLCHLLPFIEDSQWDDIRIRGAGMPVMLQQAAMRLGQQLINQYAPVIETPVPTVLTTEEAIRRNIEAFGGLFNYYDMIERLWTDGYGFIPNHPGTDTFGSLRRNVNHGHSHGRAQVGIPAGHEYEVFMGPEYGWQPIGLIVPHISVDWESHWRVNDEQIARNDLSMATTRFLQSGTLPDDLTRLPLEDDPSGY
jgi:hypothetical protein